MNNILVEKEIQNPENKTENSKKRKSNDEDQYRVVISSEVNGALENLVKRANDGFDGGEIAKSDIANFVLLNSWKSFSDADVKNLRALHFDEKKILRSILKQSGDEGELPEHLKKALREHYGLPENSKKRASRKQVLDSKTVLQES
jgi:hypothetical protein